MDSSKNPILTKRELLTAFLLSGSMNLDPADMKKRADLAIQYAEYLTRELEKPPATEGSKKNPHK